MGITPTRRHYTPSTLMKHDCNSGYYSVNTCRDFERRTGGALNALTAPKRRVASLSLEPSFQRVVYALALVADVPEH